MDHELEKSLTVLSNRIESASNAIGLQTQANTENRNGRLVIRLNLRADDRDHRWLKRHSQGLISAIEVGGQRIISRIDSEFTNKTVKLEIYLKNNIYSLHLSEAYDIFTKSSKKIDTHIYENIISRRPKRKRSQLPDPSKPADSYVNRYPSLTKQFRTDVEPELSDRVDAFRKASGKTKRQIVEEALQQYLDENEARSNRS